MYQLDAFNFPGFSKNGEKKISLPHFLYLYLFCVCVCVRERERETETERECVVKYTSLVLLLNKNSVRIMQCKWWNNIIIG